ETLPPTACSLMTSPYLSLRHGQGAYLPRFRALALFGRRLPERVARSSLPASENLHKTRIPHECPHVSFHRLRTCPALARRRCRPSSACSGTVFGAIKAQ